MDLLEQWQSFHTQNQETNFKSIMCSTSTLTLCDPFIVTQSWLVAQNIHTSCFLYLNFIRWLSDWITLCFYLETAVRLYLFLKKIECFDLVVLQWRGRYFPDGHSKHYQISETLRGQFKGNERRWPCISGLKNLLVSFLFRPPYPSSKSRDLSRCWFCFSFYAHAYWFLCLSLNGVFLKARP